MPVKKKTVKKASTSKKKSFGKRVLYTVESDVIIITGGGFLVIALSAFLFLH
jgi:hypothetical protein